MYALGYDIGSSSIKCAIINCDNGNNIAHGHYPADEMSIDAPHPGWAEQDPERWWKYAALLTRQLIRDNSIDASAIGSIGISYQMHGLVVVDHERAVLRPSIIWCDSRAVDIGNRAFQAIGSEVCLQHLLNSPGNFTASKLAWVKENEPAVYGQVDKMMLPGDFIAMKLTGDVTTTSTGLSEGILWDFQKNALAELVYTHFGFSPSLIPDLVPVFGMQGRVSNAAAEETGLRAGTPVTYRAGDQPNNAFSLNVLRPGEIAATAGTSGVVYGVLDQVRHDELSRVNQFAHVNHSPEQTRLGVLLCINGTGILNSWLRKNVCAGMSYEEINAGGSRVPVGSEGISVLPFGNGAERMLQNRILGGHVLGLDFTRHTTAHLIRAAHEGIAFSFKYGIEIMKEMGLHISVIRAGNTNMFLSPIFRQTLATVTGALIELYDTDGAVGAARGAAVGAGIYPSAEEAFSSLQRAQTVLPQKEFAEQTALAYTRWCSWLNMILSEGATV